MSEQIIQKDENQDVLELILETVTYAAESKHIQKFIEKFNSKFPDVHHLDALAAYVATSYLLDVGMSVGEVAREMGTAIQNAEFYADVWSNNEDRSEEVPEQ